MNEWVDWEKHPVPDDVKGIFIKYECGFVDCDRYYYETGKRKYRESKPVAWKFMQRINKDEKTIQCAHKFDASNLHDNDEKESFKKELEKLMDSEQYKNSTEITKAEFKLALHLRNQLIK